VPQWLTNLWRISCIWHRSALGNAVALRKSRTLPVRLALLVLLTDFVLVGVWVRCTGNLPIGEWAVWDVMLYLARLATVAVTIVLGCKHYRVSGLSLGILPANPMSDLRWSIKCCLVGASIIGAMVAAGLVAAHWLRIGLPPPPQSVVEILRPGHWSTARFVLLGVLAATAVLLAPFTEELIYRSLLLPALTSRLRLYPAIAVSAVVFGLVHVIPFGEIEIPAAQILGGLMMASAFSIRWSIIPAMVLHGMGNCFVGILCLVYVRLYVAHPTFFQPR
jgi:membrane protease YdiL (CAAX protease family)